MELRFHRSISVLAKKIKCINFDDDDDDVAELDSKLVKLKNMKQSAQLSSAFNSRCTDRQIVISGIENYS